jgi:DegV family protein with EDD domain
MMKKIAWVTDSTAFLDEELFHHPDVYVVPMTILIDGMEYVDGKDLTPNQLFEKIKQCKTPPKTSQPSVGAFTKLYQQLAKNYDQVISLLVSAKLSGTVSSSRQAAKLVSIPVLTIDSKILSYPLSVLIKQSISWNSKGVEGYEEEIHKLIETNEAYVLVGSLEQLHRSGRMSGLTYVMGSLLNVKPIISVENGLLQMKEKARTMRSAKEKIYSYIRKSHHANQLKEIYLLYGLNDALAEEWKQELKREFHDVTINCYPLGSVIGVHAGEHTIGVSWFNGLV